MTLAAGGRYVLSGVFGGGNDIRIWDGAPGKVAKTFTGHTKPCSEVVLSPDEKRVLSCAGDFSVRLWEMESTRELFRVGNLGSNIVCIAFSSDGKRFLTGAEDGSVVLRDAASGKELARFLGHTGKIHSVAFSPMDRMAASGGDDKIVRLWQLPISEGK